MATCIFDDSGDLILTNRRTAALCVALGHEAWIGQASFYLPGSYKPLTGARHPATRHALNVADSQIHVGRIDPKERATVSFSSAQRGQVGSRLGLSMVNALARKSGGRLLLASHPGRGTTVRLQRPIINAVASRRTPAAEDMPGLTRLRLLGGGWG